MNIFKAAGASIGAALMLVFLVTAAITASARLKLSTGTPDSYAFAQSIGTQIGTAFVLTVEIGLPLTFIAFLILFSRRSKSKA